MKSKRLIFITTVSFSVLIIFIGFQNCGQKSNLQLDPLIAQCTDESCIAAQIEGLAPDTTCVFQSKTLQPGDTVEAFLKSTSTDCSAEREIRTCEDGILSGSYTFASCSTSSVAKKSCSFNGEDVTHGMGVMAYLHTTVPSGNTCVSQLRSCNDGVLSGSYTFANCAVNAPASCLFNGKTIPHGKQVRAFLGSSVPSGQTCQSEMRTCINGNLSGTNTFASCSVDAPASCMFNNQTIPHQGQVQAFLNSNAVTGLSSCQRQIRSCRNGVLSGTYSFASCTMNAPASCMFNGQTIAHGGSVNAYPQASVSNVGSNGISCASNIERRTCTNGVLSGTAPHASCQNIYKDVKVGRFTLKHRQVLLVYGFDYSRGSYHLKYTPKMFNGDRCYFIGYDNDAGALRKTIFYTLVSSEAQKCGNPMMWTPISKDPRFVAHPHPSFTSNLPDGAPHAEPFQSPYRFYAPEE